MNERLEPEAERLREAARGLRIVDAHEHFGPETTIATDLCRLISRSLYLRTDLASAGMPPEAMDRLGDLHIAVEERWRMLSPYWRAVRNGAYATCLLRSLGTLYGLSDLDDATSVAEASERLRADFAAPGIFRRVLHEACGIDEVYTQGGPVDHEQPRFRWVARPMDRADFRRGGAFEEDARSLGLSVRTPDDLRAAMDALLVRCLERGACGYKIVAMPWAEPTEREIRTALRNASRERLAGNSGRTTAESSADVRTLERLYLSRIALKAAEFDVPVAVHTGFAWENWLDYRAWEPMALIPLLLRYRDTRFDLYHAGLPWGTPASPLAKVFPNVWHDLTWAHLISPELAMRSIREWLDLVPVNKVIGFGGDCLNDILVLVAGHLEMARDNLARALGQKVREGGIDEEEARRILGLWLVDNPRSLYASPR